MHFLLSNKSTHGSYFGAVLLEHSIAIAFNTIPYFFFSCPELVFMAYSLLKLMTTRCFVMYLMNCKFFLNSFNTTSVLTPSFVEHLENGRFIVVGELELELGVGRSEVVLGILEIRNRTHDRLILVFIGVLVPEQLESELIADQEVVYLPELVVARLYLRVVYIVLVRLELVAKRAY